MGPNGRWWENFINYQSVWNADVGVGPCQETFPTGWGGSVTDSLAQHMTAGQTGGHIEQGAFSEGIGTASELWNLKTAQVQDYSKYYAFADFGIYFHIWDLTMAAYDLCRTTACTACEIANGSASGPGSGQCCVPDWTNCSWSRNCSGDPIRFFNDPNYRKQFARHMGGINVGFLDGHAKWYPSEAIVNGSCPSNGWETPTIFENAWACWWPKCK